MQAAEAYTGSTQHFDVENGESPARKMEDVLSRRFPSFYGSAYRLLGNAADAEDAVQDALLSAYKHLDQFRGQSQMSTWLTAIVNNCARMQLRRRPRQTHISLDEQFGEAEEHSLCELLAGRGPSPEENCANSEANAYLRQLVRQLSPPQRRAFELRDLDGLSTSQAARALGVTDGTLKAQLSRARTNLTKLMHKKLGRQRRAGAICTALPGRNKK